MTIRIISKPLICGVACLLLAAPPVFAGDTSVNQADHPRYISGGVGNDKDSTTLRAMRYHYNVHLEFFENSNVRLLGVRVRIVGGDGKTVIDAVSTGPLFYARLPTGRYQLTATAKGKSKRLDLSVSGVKPADWSIVF